MILPDFVEASEISYASAGPPSVGCLPLSEAGEVPSDVPNAPGCPVTIQPKLKQALDEVTGNVVHTKPGHAAKTGCKICQRGEQDGLAGWRVWCCRWGMSGSAWPEWEKVHVNPVVPMQLYFSSGCVETLTRVYITSGLAFDNSMICYLVTVPYITSLTISSLIYLAVWRIGPGFVHHPVFGVLAGIGLPLSLPIIYAGYIGPQATVPFQNRYKFVVLNGIYSVFAQQSAAAGVLPNEKPAEPRTSITGTMWQALFQSIRLNDALTDLILIREMLYERNDGCWWFGEPGRCGAWTVLIESLCVFAAMDFIIALCRSISGVEVVTKRRRIMLGFSCFALICEFGVVVCTLLYLFSMKHPGNAARGERGHHKSHGAIALTFISLGTTILTFIVTLVGVSQTLSTARGAVHRINRAAAGHGHRVFRVFPATHFQAALSVHRDPEEQRMNFGRLMPAPVTDAA